jgi:hypothetical protein
MKINLIILITILSNIMSLPFRENVIYKSLFKDGKTDDEELRIQKSNFKKFYRILKEKLFSNIIKQEIEDSKIHTFNSYAFIIWDLLYTIEYIQDKALKNEIENEKIINSINYLLIPYKLPHYIKMMTNHLINKMGITSRIPNSLPVEDFVESILYLSVKNNSPIMATIIANNILEIIIPKQKYSHQEEYMYGLIDHNY